MLLIANDPHSKKVEISFACDVHFKPFYLHKFDLLGTGALDRLPAIRLQSRSVVSRLHGC